MVVVVMVREIVETADALAPKVAMSTLLIICANLARNVPRQENSTYHSALALRMPCVATAATKRAKIPAIQANAHA